MQPIFRSVLLMERLFYDEVDFLNGKQGLAQHTLANILHSPTHNPATPWGTLQGRIQAFKFFSRGYTAKEFRSWLVI